MSSKSKEVKTNDSQDVKKEESTEKRTIAGRYFVPTTDIIETKDNLQVLMDMPGVKKDNLKINLENNVLDIEGLVDTLPYEGLVPKYTEYNIGHYSRQFNLSNTIDTNNINAEFNDGVLTLTLPKAPESEARKIAIK